MRPAFEWWITKLSISSIQIDYVHIAYENWHLNLCKKMVTKSDEVSSEINTETTINKCYFGSIYFH